jgi:NAD(P)-dependent dehydrogenase (short-subunit alcohol dehydrogenase family)
VDLVDIISSLVADRPLKALPAALMAITKGGINALTQSLDIEYADRGFRENAVAPGAIRTPLHAINTHPSLRLCMDRIGEIQKLATLFSILKMHHLSSERFYTSTAVPTRGTGEVSILPSAQVLFERVRKTGAKIVSLATRSRTA